MGQESGAGWIQNGISTNDQESDLAQIHFTGNNPYQLFKEWLADAHSSDLISPNALCFSTSNKEGKPSSRHLLLRKLEDDGFIIMTDSRSRKVADLTDNPHASIAFLWCYWKGNKRISRQVRIEGCVEEVSQSACQEIWDTEPLFCKIRANMCYQGQPVDWEEQKKKHDRLHRDYLTKNQMPTIPNHVGYFRVIPTFMDFYFTFNNCIADRLAFHRLDANVWKMQRIAA